MTYLLPTRGRKGRGKYLTRARWFDYVRGISYYAFTRGKRAMHIELYDGRRLYIEDGPDFAMLELSSIGSDRTKWLLDFANVAERATPMTPGAYKAWLERIELARKVAREARP